MNSSSGSVSGLPTLARSMAWPPAMPREPLACAMNIFRRSAIEPGQTVAIVGIGFLGAVLTKLATDAGARVIAMLPIAPTTIDGQVSPFDPMFDPFWARVNEAGRPSPGSVRQPTPSPSTS